jgi:hypothetical protein
LDVSEEFHHFMFQLFFPCGFTEIHGNPACLMVENLCATRRQRDKEGGQTGQISQKGRVNTQKGRADRADIPKRKGRQGRHPKKEGQTGQTVLIHPGLTGLDI